MTSLNALMFIFGTISICASSNAQFKREVNVRPAVKACQTYSNRPVDRVLGGELAGENEFPWMVALGYIETRRYEVNFNCGGTLISNQFVITAAHCTSPSHSPILVRLGDAKLGVGESEKSVSRTIQEIFRHANYSVKSHKNDISLIKLSTPVQFTENIRPACLYADANDLSSDIKLLVTGWGSKTSEHTTRSNELLKAQLQTKPHAECNSIVLEFNKNVDLPGFRDGISEGQYCAYDPQEKSDSCAGDGGGPLQFFPDGSSVAHIVGIVSFGVRCGSSIPGFYTRVAHYLDWIEPIVWP